jgi:hypothetical protein
VVASVAVEAIGCGYGAGLAEGGSALPVADGDGVGGSVGAAVGFGGRSTSVPADAVDPRTVITRLGWPSSSPSTT